MAGLWVIARNDEPFVLWLEPVTKAEAERMIRWQRTIAYDSTTEFFICRLIGWMFECIQTGRRFSPVKSFYTDEAWTRFRTRIGRST